MFQLPDRWFRIGFDLAGLLWVLGIAAWFFLGWMWAFDLGTAVGVLWMMLFRKPKSWER